MSDEKETRDLHNALEFVGDVDRRLPGEDPETGDAEDARHWGQVYRELTEFKRGMVEKARSDRAGLLADAQPEVGNDLTILEAELHRLETRRDFWLRRELELEDR